MFMKRNIQYVDLSVFFNLLYRSNASQTKYQHVSLYTLTNTNGYVEKQIA